MMEARAVAFLSDASSLNEAYWPNDGIRYRSCDRCGINMELPKRSSLIKCGDCR